MYVCMDIQIVLRQVLLDEHLVLLGIPSTHHQIILRRYKPVEFLEPERLPSNLEAVRELHLFQLLRGLFLRLPQHLFACFQSLCFLNLVLFPLLVKLRCIGVSCCAQVHDHLLKFNVAITFPILQQQCDGVLLQLEGVDELGNWISSTGFRPNHLIQVLPIKSRRKCFVDSIDSGIYLVEVVLNQLCTSVSSVGLRSECISPPCLIQLYALQFSSNLLPLLHFHKLLPLGFDFGEVLIDSLVER
mmetsp:Transcript_5423/g.14146  ORF Transcript_5423/g.14146 Transcript_5423/m.14146 type:complete len:244 (+) Transcript_5423:429-1160(+)